MFAGLMCFYLLFISLVEQQDGRPVVLPETCTEDDGCQALPLSNAYRLVQTEMVALLASARLESCLFPLSEAGVTTTEQLKARCCDQRRSCREKLELPLNTKAEKQRWDGVIDTLCQEEA
eukprot:m.115555 g.115555  ORF g.115555 m.115555 type:complete len:120 (+) comp15374_c1_seq1:86-445(+)